MKYAFLGTGRKVHRVKQYPLVKEQPFHLARCGLQAYQQSDWRSTDGPETCLLCPKNNRWTAQEFDAWPDEPDYDPRD